jgi:hypothetical protein
MLLAELAKTMCEGLKITFVIRSFEDSMMQVKKTKIIKSTKQGNLNVWKVQGLGKQNKKYANECAIGYNPMMS